MRRVSAFVVVTAIALAIPVLRADVKTTERTQMKLEGMLGRLMRTGDGVASTTVVKGSRKLSVNDSNGEIIDLAEEKVYRLDVKKKEYRVLTFEQIRKEWQEATADAEKNAKKIQEAQRDNPDAMAGAKLEFSADVKETGQRKTIAGYEAREVVLTITGTQAGKTLEAGGGSVMTNTMWIGPKIPALDEINAFNVKYFKAIIGDEGAQALQQLTTVFAMFISAKPMMDTMQAEGRKLEGTPLVSTIVMENVRGADQKPADEPQSGGGGIGGMLARRIGGRGSSGPRSTVFTSTHEYLTVTTSASADDVAIPAGFKEKK